MEELTTPIVEDPKRKPKGYSPIFPLGRDLSEWRTASELATNRVSTSPLILAMGMLLTRSPMAGSELPWFVTMSAIFTAIGGLNQLLVQSPLEKILLNKNQIIDSRIQLDIQAHVYRGTQPISYGSNNLEHGDAFTTIYLPKVLDSAGEEVATETARYQEALLRHITQEYKPHKAKGIKAIAITAPQDLHYRTPEIDYRNLMKKKVDIEEEIPTVLLSKDEFELLQNTSEDLLRELSLHINDHVLKKWIIERGKAEKPKQIEIEKMMRLRAVMLIEGQLDARYNGPERMPDLGTKYTRQHGDPIVRTSNRLSRVTRSSTGLLYRQVTPSIGSVEERKVAAKLRGYVRGPESMDLDQLLYDSTSPIEDIVAENSPFRDAKLLYILDKVLGDIENGRLKTHGENNLSIEELLEEYKERKFSIVASHDFKRRDPSTRKKLAVSYFRRSTVLNMLVGFIEGVGIATAFGGGPLDLMQFMQTQRNVTESHFSPDRGSGILPPASTVWHINSVDSKPTGYFIEKTYPTFSDGRWEEETKVVGELQNASQMFPDGPHTSLSRSFVVPPFGGLEFKVPLKEGEDFFRIHIEDEEGNTIPHTALRLVDGTVRVQFKSSSINFKNVLVHATTIPVESGGAFASDRTDIEYAALPVRDRLALSRRGLRPDEASFEQVREYVQGGNLYSLEYDPAKQLEKAKDPQERLSTELALEKANCSAAAEESVLLYSALGGTDVGIATGYVAGLGGLNSNVDTSPDVDTRPGHISTLTGSLRADTAHAFALGSDGVVRDATPQQIFGDDLTKKYLEQLAGKAKGSSIAEEFDIDMINSLYYLLVGGGTAVGSISLYKFAKGRVKGTMPDIGATWRNTIDKILPDDDVQHAYGFFSALAYSQKPTESIAVDSYPSVQATFQKLQEEVPAHILHAYLESPKSYEKLAGIKGTQAGMLRTIALLALKVPKRYMKEGVTSIT